MKFNKKGFTLIELLAVIAILAILMVIAVPAVLDLFNSSKESAFITQAETIYKAAEQQILSDALSGATPVAAYTNTDSVTTNDLSLSGGTTVKYYVEVDTATSTITCVSISNTSFKLLDKSSATASTTVASISGQTLVAKTADNEAKAADCN